MGSECTFSRLKWWGEIVWFASGDAESMPVLLFISLAPLLFLKSSSLGQWFPATECLLWSQLMSGMQYTRVHYSIGVSKDVGAIWSFLASYERHPPQAWSIPNEAQFLMSFSGMPMDDPPTQVLDAAASSWRNCTTCSTADDDSFDHWSATGPVDRWGSVQWLGGQVEVGWSVSKAKYNWVYLAIHMICGFHDFSCRFGKAFEVMNLVAQVRWLGFYPTAIRTRTADL